LTELCDQTAVELRSRLQRRESSPREILDSCRARIERIDPALNAIVATDWQAAEKAADQAEREIAAGEAAKPLLGLPVGIKDLNDTAGLRTTYGSLLYADHVPSRDDYVTASVRKAGGIIAAKTNTPEFGAGANTFNAVYGATGNPFDPLRTCGGSSGGSAVALSTSMLPLASGSDLGGSLRTPAGYCGVVGFRCSSGQIPDLDRLMAWNPLAVDGPMARNVADLSLLHSALVGQVLGDPLSVGRSPESFRDPEPADLAKLRVAFSEDLGFAPVDNGVREVFRTRVAKLGSLFAALEAKDPNLSEANRVFEVLRAVGFLAAHKERFERFPEKVGPNVTANVKLGLTFSADDVAQASLAHTQLYRRFLGFMETWDLLICPVAAVPPFDKEQLYPTEINGQALETYISWLGLSFGITLTAHPSIALPCGLDRTGTPFAIQLVGRRGRDLELLQAARALETALAEIDDCRRPLPDLDRLAAQATSA